MPRSLESTIDELKELLPYIARDAERYRNPTELVSKSRELHIAARAITETLPHPSLSDGPVLKVRIGSKAVEGYRLRKLPYDFVEAEMNIANPSEEYDLRFASRIRTNTFNPNPGYTQPIFGQRMYFDLATLGRTLEDGGELGISR